MKSIRSRKASRKAKLHCPVCLGKNIRVVFQRVNTNLHNPKVYCQAADCRADCMALFEDDESVLCYYSLRIKREGYWFESDDVYQPPYERLASYNHLDLFRVCRYDKRNDNVETIFEVKGSEATKLRQFAERWLKAAKLMK